MNGSPQGLPFMIRKGSKPRPNIQGKALLATLVLSQLRYESDKSITL
jgi:hypothetical protein